MSVIEQLEQKLNRVIGSVTDHARFSRKLNEDLAAIESKVASDIEAKFTALRAELLGEAAAISSEGADALDTAVGALTSGLAPAARPAASGNDGRIDPDTGLPVAP